jgi:predicted Zn-dependent protease
VLPLIQSTAFTQAESLTRVRGVGIYYQLEANSGDELELQLGTALTRNGQFAAAIPHLLAAQGRVANQYAAKFNLALCYVGTNQFRQSVQLLIELRAGDHDNADVNNLLAQAYVGDSQNDNAWEALQRAANFTPTNEKLYMLVADACMGKQQYALGLRVVDLGLHHLPDSARLHYERGMFLALSDQFDIGKRDFDLARELSPDSDIAFTAAAQKAMFEGNVSQAIRVTRDGIGKGHQEFILLALLGEALLRSGITPGEREFSEARQALEASVSKRANYAGSQLALGKLYLLEDRVSGAIMHLEAARQLSPEDPAVYSNLAAAYRKRGDLRQAQNALAVLAKLNQAQAEKIRTSPGARKASYGESRVSQPHQ